MEPNCFFCKGMNQECVNERRYIRYGDYDDCIFYAMAKNDLDKLERRDFKSINLKKMLAQHLGRINLNDERILKILA